MYHQFSSMLAVLLLVIAAVTVLIMLEMNSKMEVEESAGKNTFHNILSSIFLFLFAGLLAYLIFSAGGFQESFSNSPQLIYIILALLLVPLLIIRAVIARRKARISTRLLLLGSSIFILSFGLTGIAAKYYALHGGDLKYALLAATDSNIVSVETGQAVMNRKCSKCHSLERVYTTNTTDWSATVTKMAGFDPNINESDVKLITEYLNQLRNRVPQRTGVERGRDLVSAKCGKCHSLDKVFSANMNADRWAETVDDMIKIIGLPDFISAQEKKDIIEFLVDRRRERREMWSKTTSVDDLSDEQMNRIRRLLARKCSAGCHALDRVLRSRSEKNREQWIETINSMIEITGDPDFLSDQEKKDIIDYLSQPVNEEKTTKAGSQLRSSSASHPLISRKCETCHNLDRVHEAVKSKEEWAATVKNMAAHAKQNGVNNFLSEKDQKDIVTIISSWEVQKKQ